MKRGEEEKEGGVDPFLLFSPPSLIFDVTSLTSTMTKDGKRREGEGEEETNVAPFFLPSPSSRWNVTSNQYSVNPPAREREREQINATKRKK